MEEDFTPVRNSVIAVCLLAASGLARGDDHTVDVNRTSLEDLMNMEVTSVSRKGEKLSQTAAAVYVITQEEIRRSGANNIPDALRLAPGLQVARVNSNEWAVTSRGFNGLYSNKLLVLIDGRTVYTPLFSGVHWDTQDLVMEDIDRIEVIRGPGRGRMGSQRDEWRNQRHYKKRERHAGASGYRRSGHRRTHRRDRPVWRPPRGNPLRIASLANTSTAARWPLPHRSGRWTAGERGALDFDWTAISTEAPTSIRSKAKSIKAKRAKYRLPARFTPAFAANFWQNLAVSGGDVVASWTRFFRNGSDATTQVYFDSYDRQQSSLGEGENTLDFDFKDHLPVLHRQDIIWGVGRPHGLA